MSDFALQKLTEEDLRERSIGGDELATGELLGRFEGYAIVMAQSNPIPGIPREDVIQEIRIAVHGAIREFNPLLSIPFGAYAKMVARARLNNLRRDQARHKRATLDRAESLDAPPPHSSDDAGSATLGETIAAPGDAYQTAMTRADMRAALPLSPAGGDLDTLLAFVDRQGLDAVVDAFYLEPRSGRGQHLSRTETKIALAYIDQVPPAQIAVELRMTAKQLDNHRRRVMTKLAGRLRSHD